MVDGMEHEAGGQVEEVNADADHEVNLSSSSSNNNSWISQSVQPPCPPVQVQGLCVPVFGSMIASHSQKELTSPAVNCSEQSPAAEKTAQSCLERIPEVRCASYPARYRRSLPQCYESVAPWDLSRAAEKCERLLVSEKKKNYMRDLQQQIEENNQRRCQEREKTRREEELLQQKIASDNLVMQMEFELERKREREKKEALARDLAAMMKKPEDESKKDSLQSDAVKESTESKLKTFSQESLYSSGFKVVPSTPKRKRSCYEPSWCNVRPSRLPCQQATSLNNDVLTKLSRLRSRLLWEQSRIETEMNCHLLNDIMADVGECNTPVIYRPRRSCRCCLDFDHLDAFTRPQVHAQSDVHCEPDRRQTKRQPDRQQTPRQPDSSQYSDHITVSANPSALSLAMSLNCPPPIRCPPVRCPTPTVEPQPCEDANLAEERKLDKSPESSHQIQTAPSPAESFLNDG